MVEPVKLPIVPTTEPLVVWKIFAKQVRMLTREECELKEVYLDPEELSEDMMNKDW